MRNTYLVCYDITDDKRRDRVFKVCKNHGEHLQFSVFECDLNGMVPTFLLQTPISAVYGPRPR
jgi:CRISPR-associated endonuclease Cas2